MTPFERVYLDHQATTPIDARVLDAMEPWLRERHGNAASRSHVFGWEAGKAMEAARSILAAGVGGRAREIVFTSGATESNNLALLGYARACKDQGTHLVSARTEHKSVLEPLEALEREGFSITWLEVDGEGRLDPAHLKAALMPETSLVSLMHANNEVGTLHPIGEIGALCREHGAAFHCDAAQAGGRIPLDVQASRIDLLSLSAHKFYGPKGVGALFVRSRDPRVRLQARQFGGGHEGGLRPGTLPVAGIVGMAKALELALAEREAEEGQGLDRRAVAFRRREHVDAGHRLGGGSHPRDALLHQ